mmetsp:Transcript_19769/g.28856  ORF Transcript_19769/g.28856 Transcript_19769/m.28856 type:complete len:98 (-) Transcript_19769:991-1284(-)
MFKSTFVSWSMEAPLIFVIDEPSILPLKQLFLVLSLIQHQGQLGCNPKFTPGRFSNILYSQPCSDFNQFQTTIATLITVKYAHIRNDPVHNSMACQG